MSKILIIGVGGAGATAVARMKKVGVPNAEYLTMGDPGDDAFCIPHYNLIEVRGFESLPYWATAEDWRECAEQAKDGILEIIESHIKGES